jgi:hypothetical protein
VVVGGGEIFLGGDRRAEVRQCLVEPAGLAE